MKLSDISQINMKTKRLNRLHKKHADQALASLGIHIGQSLILEVLLAKEACTQKEIATYLQISTSSITNPIKRLEEKNLIQKKQSSTDLRYNSITLTADGMATAKTIITTIEDIDQTMTSDFDPTEIKLLNKLMDRMIHNLEPDFPVTELKKDEYSNMYKNYLEVNNEHRNN